MPRPVRAYVHAFAPGAPVEREGASLRALLGLQGDRMSDLARRGFPVLPGFVISTEACAYYLRHQGEFPPGLWPQIETAWAAMTACAHTVLDAGSAHHRIELRFDAAGPAPELPPPIPDLSASAARSRHGNGAAPDTPPVRHIREALTEVYEAWKTGEAARRNARGSNASLLGAAAMILLRPVPSKREPGGSGWAVSRDPETGAGRPSGLFHPADGGAAMLLDTLGRARTGEGRVLYRALCDLLRRLEAVRKYPQEIEFIACRGRVWIGHAAPARPKQPGAGARWVYEMTAGRDARTGRTLPRLLSPDEALLALEPAELTRLATAESQPARRGQPRRRADPAARAMYRAFSEWTQQRQRLTVHAETPNVDAALRARHWGASGIGVPPGGFAPPSPALRAAFRDAARAAGPGRTARGHGAWERALAAEWEPFVRLSHKHALGAVFPAGPGPEPEVFARAMALAILEGRRLGYHVRGCLMIPGFCALEEFREGAARARAAVREADAAEGPPAPFAIGALIQTPRAALLADRLAETAEALCFDAAALDPALRGGAAGPAAAFDAEGMGALLEHAVRLARGGRHAIPCGVRGLPAADPAAFRFLLKIGMDYVVCPADDVPAARLASAQAGL